MKLISWNVNGLMSGIKADIFKQLKDIDPDIICLQEIRTKREPVVLPGYAHLWNHAERSGYSGTLILTRMAPLNVTNGAPGMFLGVEGRIITLEFNHFFLTEDEDREAKISNVTGPLPGRVEPAGWPVLVLRRAYSSAPTESGHPPGPRPAALCQEQRLYPPDLRAERDGAGLDRPEHQLSADL